MKQLLLLNVFLLSVLIPINGLAQEDYKIDELRMYSWDEIALEWEHQISQTYEYANGGNKETNVLGSTVPGLEKTYQYNKTYNANNDIILSEEQFWDAPSKQWFNNSRLTYTYDASNNLVDLTRKRYNHSTMAYINDIRDVYTYSGSDMQTETKQVWNTSTSAWDNDERLVLTYISGLATKGVFSIWEDSSWEEDEIHTVTYNSNNLPERVLAKSYNGSNWVNYGNTLYSYSGTLQTQSVNQSWNEGAWENEERELSTYDANGNQIVNVLEIWNFIIDEWEPSYKEEVAYSKASLGVANFNVPEVSLSPNPVTDVLQITLNRGFSSETDLTLYSMDGKIIMSKRLHPLEIKTSLNLELMAQGVYLLQIGNEKIQRIIKR